MWSAVREVLQEKLGRESFRNWIHPLVCRPQKEGDVVDDVVTLEAPTEFVRDWVMTHFHGTILESFQTLNARVKRLEVGLVSCGSQNDVSILGEGEKGVGEGEKGDLFGQKSREVRVQKPAAESAVLSMGSVLDPRLTFDNFVVGKPNEFAYAAALRVAESAGVSFNPLFLHGGVGLGKTHLMHAIAHHIRKMHPHRSVVYLSAEKFMYHFIKALRFKDTVTFKDQLRSAHVLMIDDIQFISGKESTQEEFFHTFNALVDQKRQVVLSADKSPSDLQGIEERVRSRLAWGLAADIHPTTYELRLGILESKAETLGNVPHTLLEFLAQKITSNIRELEGALTRITAHANLVGRQMSIEMAKEVLKDLLRACDRVVTLEDIQKFVANYYSVSVGALSSSKRSKEVVIPRQMAMFLSKKLTTKSFPEIGRAFGGRDHTTVLHGVRKISSELETNSKIKEDVDLLSRMLQA